MSDSLSGTQSAFTAHQTLYYQKNKNFRFSQVSFIKSIDLRISIFEKVLPTNLSILEFNLLSVYHLVVSQRAGYEPLKIIKAPGLSC